MANKTAEYPPAYRNYVLGALFAVYLLNFVDRQIVAILLESIKEELQLSDTQLGIVTGLAFAIFNATAGIFIARWADRSSRRSILALAIAVWSVMTALCGLATNYFYLVLARIGVGLGEAGSGPPSHSLISDYFPPEKRATALSIYTTGISIGVLFALLIGGWVNQFFGWRYAFFVVGIPGLLMAALVRLTIKEPPRGLSDQTSAPIADTLALPDAIRRLWSIPTYRNISIGAGVYSILLYATLNWTAAHFIRFHGMQTGILGTYLALIVGIAGGLGTFSAGFLADYLSRRTGDRSWAVRLGGYSALAAVPLFAVNFLSEDPTVALLAATPAWFLGSMWLGPIYSTVQTVSGIAYRALAASVTLFVVNIVGFGLGPVSVGILSDYLQDSFATRSVGVGAAFVVIVSGTWGALHFLAAARHAGNDIKNADSA